MPGPTATTPKEWFKADAGVYKDLGVTACANNDACEQWNDQSGNANHATQTTAGTRFIYKTNQLNGLPGLQCVRASGTHMNRVSTADPQTIFIVAKITSFNAFMALLGADTGDASPPAVGAYYFQQFSGNHQILFDRCTAADTTSGSNFAANDPLTLATGQAYIFKGWRSGTTIKALSGPGWGGVSESGTGSWPSGTSASAVRSIAAPIVLGADVYNRSVTDSWDGMLFEVLTYDVALSDIETGQVEAYLFAKWLQPSSPTYMLSNFFGDASNTYLQISSSSDGINFLEWPCQYTRHSTDLVRDSSVLPTTRGGKYWIAHTISDSNCTYFDIANSNDGMTWSYVASVDCSSVVSTGHTWAPEWFTDATAPQGYRVFLALSATSAGNSQIYEIHPTNAGFTTWSLPVALTGTGLSAVNMIDPFMYLHSGTYYLVYCNTATGKVGVFSSSSLLTGYTSLYSDIGAGQMEGPCMTLQGSNWVLYGDTKLFGGGGLSYTTQAVGAGDWTGTNATAWSALTTVPLTPDSTRLYQQGTVALFPVAPPVIQRRTLPTLGRIGTRQPVRYVGGL